MYETTITLASEESNISGGQTSKRESNIAQSSEFTKDSMKL